MMQLSFFTKAPKGEPRAKAAWWACIANEAQKEIERTGQHCTRDPVTVSVEFFLPCPMGKRYSAPHVTAPGLPALVYALGGMRGIVIEREEQIVDLKLSKAYNGPYSAGAQVTVVSEVRA